MEPPTESITVNEYTFFYYARSGGVVITQGATVVDAGIIGNRGPITRDRLNGFALGWLVYRRDYRYQWARMQVVIGNRPTDQATNPPT